MRPDIEVPNCWLHEKCDPQKIDVWMLREPKSRWWQWWRNDREFGLLDDADKAHWREFREAMLPDDELWSFDNGGVSGPNWRAGFAVVRQGKVVASFLEWVS